MSWYWIVGSTVATAVIIQLILQRICYFDVLRFRFTYQGKH